MSFKHLLKSLLEVHRYPFGAWIVLFISLALTAIAWKISQDAILEKAETRFNLNSDEIAAAITERLHTYEMAIRSGKAYFDSSQEVTREEWNQFVSSLKIEYRFPGIQGLGYSEFIKPDELDAHVAKIRAEGFPNYSVRPPGKRDMYTSIVFLEPFDWRNKRAFGYDMYSQETRREAMNRARDTGSAAVSGQVTLVQETTTDVQYGFLLYEPVYRKNAEILTLEQRREAIIGYVYSPFRAKDFMQGILNFSHRGLYLELYDGNLPNENSVLYKTNGIETLKNSNELTFSRTLTLNHSQRVWSLKITAGPEYLAQDTSLQPTMVGILGVIIDLLLFAIITYMGRKERLLEEHSAALIHAKQVAETASSAKSNFLAAMSHEIRTPMNGVIGMIEVLNQSSLKGDQVDMVRTIQESANGLLLIINDILDFSKIEAGKMELNIEPISIEHEVDKVALLLDRSARKQKVQINVFIDPEIPSVVNGDALRLRQIITNLLGNAIKFSTNRDKPSNVIVKVILEHLENKQAWVKLSVEDNGIGISPELQQKLFQPFEQADRSTTRSFGGTGLGLSISKQLVQMMGGTIDVESVPNQGSTFTCELPFKVLQEHSIESHLQQPDLTQLHCTLISKNQQDGNFQNILRYLTAAGMHIQTASSIQKAAELTPEADIWLVDCLEKLPSLNRLHPYLDKYPQIRILLLSQYVANSDRIRSSRKLHDRVFQSDGNLLTRSALFRFIALGAGLVEQTITESEDSTQRLVINVPSREEAINNKQLILVAEDNEVNQNVIRRQLALLGYMSDIVNNGSEALESWYSGEYSLILTDLHMPLMDGIQLTEAIRTEEKRVNAPLAIPIIALTANALKGEEDKCREVGMNDYLVKPALISEIQQALETWLPATETTTKNTADQRIRTLQEPPHFDIHVLFELVGDDQEIVDSLLQDFETNTKKTISELQAAQEANNLEQIGQLAHRLKSSAASVGALKLRLICIELQQKAEKADKNQADRLNSLNEIIDLLEAETTMLLAAIQKYRRDSVATD
ncbi:CHASE domain-containing protein [Thiosulfatimonas sediminis]|nr:CHASE domain-containing protein [Thiosulfatimonas sediminis]